MKERERERERERENGYIVLMDNSDIGRSSVRNIVGGQVDPVETEFLGWILSYETGEVVEVAYLR